MQGQARVQMEQGDGQTNQELLLDVEAGVPVLWVMDGDEVLQWGGIWIPAPGDCIGIQLHIAAGHMNGSAWLLSGMGVGAFPSSLCLFPGSDALEMFWTVVEGELHA